MISLKKYNKMIFVIIILSLTIFIFSMVSSILILNYKNNNEMNSFQNSETIVFKYDDSKTITFNEVVNILDKYNNSKIFIEYSPIPKYLDNETIFGKGIYYNDDMNKEIPILEGRIFSLKEINSEEKVVLVGKNIRNEILSENNESFFLIGKEKFKVIGILGSNDRQTGYDDTFIINLKSSEGFSDSRSDWKLNVDDKNNLNYILDEYSKLAVKNNSNFQLLEGENQKLNFSKIFQSIPEFTYILLSVFGLAALNLIIAVYYWMDKSIKEIGVRKAYGASNFKIAMHIIKQYQISVIISLIIGVFAHSISKKFLVNIFPMFTFEIYYQNLIVITLIFMIIGLIVALITIVRARKVQPISIMKGSLK